MANLEQNNNQHENIESFESGNEELTENDLREAINETSEQIAELTKRDREVDSKEKQLLMEGYDKEKLAAVYISTEEIKNYEKLKADLAVSQIENKVDSNFNKTKDELIGKITSEKDKKIKEELKIEFEEFVKKEAENIFEKEGKKEALEFLLNNVNELSLKEIESQEGTKLTKVVNKVAEVIDKTLFFYLPKKWKEGKYGKYLVYASTAAMGTALMAASAPASGAALGSYFALKLVKTVIGAKVGGLVGVSMVKLYEKAIADKKEEEDKQEIEKAVESGKNISQIFELVKKLDEKKLSRENNKLLLSVLAAMVAGFSTYNLMEAGEAIASPVEKVKTDYYFSKNISDGAKMIFTSSSLSSKIIHNLHSILNFKK